MKEVLFDEMLDIITPCFCAGANQAKAEVRAPSIRGELRWWFRALGGSQAEEQAVFGGIAGEEGTASALLVRVSEQTCGTPIKLPSMRMGTPLSYLLHYANASGKPKGKKQYGPRFSKEGMLPPGSCFRLQFILRRSLENGLAEKLSRAIEAMLWLGTIGYRGRRACGAWSCRGSTLASFRQWVDSVPELQVDWAKDKNGPRMFGTWQEVMKESEQQLKRMRATYSSKHPSPLGSSSPRQASGVRFRPICVDGRYLAVVVYASYALGSRSATSSFYLTL